MIWIIFLTAACRCGMHFHPRWNQSKDILEIFQGILHRTRTPEDDVMLLCLVVMENKTVSNVLSECSWWIQKCSILFCFKISFDIFSFHILSYIFISTLQQGLMLIRPQNNIGTAWLFETFSRFESVKSLLHFFKISLVSLFLSLVKHLAFSLRLQSGSFHHCCYIWQ